MDTILCCIVFYRSLENRKEFCHPLVPSVGWRNGGLHRISGKKGHSSVQLTLLSLRAKLPPWADLEAPQRTANCGLGKSPLIPPNQANYCMSLGDLRPSTKFPQCNSHSSSQGYAVNASLSWAEMPGSALHVSHYGEATRFVFLSPTQYGSQKTLTYTSQKHWWSMMGRAPWKSHLIQFSMTVWKSGKETIQKRDKTIYSLKTQNS